MVIAMIDWDIDQYCARLFNIAPYLGQLFLGLAVGTSESYRARALAGLELATPLHSRRVIAFNTGNSVRYMRSPEPCLAFIPMMESRLVMALKNPRTRARTWEPRTMNSQ